MDSILNYIAADLQLNLNAVKSTVSLLGEGGTVPFIARYRKERTGGLDETRIREIHERLEHYTELEKRKETVLKTIGEQGKLTPELEKEITACREKQKLEDLYLPFKPKRTTRAGIAREKGLGPLADLILAQETVNGVKEDIAASFLNPEKGVKTAGEALAGAVDIVAEALADNAALRETLRQHLVQGKLVSKVRKEWEGKKTKFEMYYDYSEPVKKIASHRLLAVRRGAKEEVLSWKIEADGGRALDLITAGVVKNARSLFQPELTAAVHGAWERLLCPSLQVEVFCLKLEEAEKEAITVFSKNARNLLLAPPAGPRAILGVDPGFRTGCKLAVIDGNGNFREYCAIFPHEPHNKKDEAEKAVLALVRKHGVELIAIGNGTASKETRIFIAETVKKHGLAVRPIMVSEAGASVYSASPLAGAEFPDLDVTVRGAISIARRLQDPLAELVKIDPKSIGVGQYQHDVNQYELKKSLDATVESCVNYVGVNLNSASAELLSCVAGIGKTLAKNIVAFRAQKGSFAAKDELREVPKLGKKAFEQCAGFLRVAGANPLDNSAIHPERYAVVEQMATDLGAEVHTLVGNESLLSRVDPGRYVSEEAGLPTLTDIMQELKKPGLDPRSNFESVLFSAEINRLEDLKTGMVLDGVVTNVTGFGAFVDVGVHQDGLVHISKMSDKYVRDPHEAACVGDSVRVRVLAVDTALKRISLEMLR
ncbi:MAG: Tex family protein [Endomicrobiales bacterium]